MQKLIKKILTSPWTALLTLALIISIRIADPVFVESVRLRYFDTLITQKTPTANNIYTVNIDEAALDKYGQWPLPRAEYAKIIKDLYDRGAGLVVLNVIMAEPDRTGGDAVLANALKQYPVVLSSTPHDGKTKNVPRKPGTAVINSEFVDSITQYRGLIANVPVLENNAVGVGTTHTKEEIDGVNRRLPLVITVDGDIYPSLAMETLRVAAGDSTTQIKLFDGGVEKMRIPKFGPITTDALGRVWIDWSQENKQASLMDLPKNFNGAIVIVGPTAAGIANPLPTTKGAVWPQDVQAAAVATMVNGVVIQRPDYADGAEIIALLAFGMLLIFLSRWTYVGIGATVVIVGAVVPGTMYAFNNWLILSDATAIAFGLVIVALHTYGVKFVSEFLQKQAIKKQFEGYASPTVVKLLQENPDIIKNGTKREVSIVFSDLRGFTPLGESFGDDVKGLTAVMNGYMDAITQPVLDADGMIIKYIGDASMHIHNAPIDDPRHAKTAVATGLKMLKAVKEFSIQLEATGRPGVKMGAGINTGLGYIGEMGSTRRHSYDVLGDAVSTAARIESKCKEYGCVLLVGGATVEQCDDDFFFLKVDDLAVKGKTVGVAIYTVLDDVAADYHVSKKIHDAMHGAYRAQNFSTAISMCKQLRDQFDSRLTGYYDMWIERCEFQLTQDLPEDWNGVFIATSK
jgi:adenylate cyclase